MNRKRRHRNVMIHDGFVAAPEPDKPGRANVPVEISERLGAVIFGSPEQIRARIPPSADSVFDLIVHYEDYIHPDFDLNHVKFSARLRDGRHVTSENLVDDERSWYEHARDTAKIFRVERNQTAFSAADLVNWALDVNGKQFEDLVPDNTKRRSPEPFLFSFPISVGKGALSINLIDGPADIVHLELLVAITWLTEYVDRSGSAG